MIDFDNLREKAEEIAKEHPDQIDRGIDKAAEMAGKKYGHGQQIEQVADKLEQMLTGGDDAEAGNRPARGKGAATSGPRRGGKPGSEPKGQGRPRRPKG